MIPESLLGRLSFAPAPPSLPPLAPGRHLLGLSEQRDAVLYVPDALDTSRPIPLVVLFHGGGGSAERILPALQDLAGQHRFLLLAPQSVFRTWDLIVCGNGPDLERLDAALSAVAARYPLDPAHLAFAGFSDGGSYALSVGLTNGDIVSHVIAYSPGRMDLFLPEGEPRIFIAHGVEDEQIPFAKIRNVATTLEEAGYDVTFLGFHGRHVVLPAIAQLTMASFLKDR